MWRVSLSTTFLYIIHVRVQFSSQVGKWDQNTAQVKGSVQVCSSSNLDELCNSYTCMTGARDVWHLLHRSTRAINAMQPECA